MRIDHAYVYVWLIVRWTCRLLVYSQPDSEEILKDEGSGELDPVAEVNIEVKPKDTFRDLICFQCSGRSCANHHYHEPLRHLVVSCQACYKEWDHFKQDSTRKCFFPSDLTELNHSNVTVGNSMCGVIERGNRLSYYCFCYLDYCNHGNRLSPAWTVLYLILWLTYLFHYSFPNLPLSGGHPGGAVEPQRRVGMAARLRS